MACDSYRIGSDYNHAKVLLTVITRELFIENVQVLSDSLPKETGSKSLACLGSRLN